VKLLVFGLGNCGSKIAGEFSELNKKARNERRTQIVTNAYAINNDQQDSASLKNSYRELQTIFVNRIIEGKKSAKAGADIMREEGHRVLLGVKAGDFYNTDAILLVAGAAGYFGSGGLPVLAQQLKDRHTGKPIYTIIILPMDSEASDPEAIINTAVCLKSIQQVTDAVFVVDNNRFKLQADNTPANNMNAANKEIVLQYYDLLCASERTDPKFAGARSLGIGDMMQTLKGWTAIGTGKTDFQVASKPFWKSTSNFQEKGAETQKAMEAMNLALGKLSIDFQLGEAHKAIYLLSIPAEGANINMVKAIGNRLLELTKNAEIRGGDYYGVRNHAQVTLVISDLAYVDIIKNYYDRAISLTKPIPDASKKEEQPGASKNPDKAVKQVRKYKKKKA
jgi:tubulin-like protein CetZ